MSTRLYIKPMPLTLALHFHSDRILCPSRLGIRFTPTLFTIAHLAERRGDLRFESAECVWEQIYENAYLDIDDRSPVPGSIRMLHFHKSQATDKRIKNSLYKAGSTGVDCPAPDIHSPQSTGRSWNTRSAPVQAVLRTECTWWKVNIFSIFINETHFQHTAEAASWTNTVCCPIA
jgi:hypothetical protein